MWCCDLTVINEGFFELSVWSEERALPIQSLHHGKRWNMLFDYNNNDDLKFKLRVEYPSCLYCSFIC